MGEHRFQGEWPKIGIRPTIDGRMGGVRESLEKQTMDMAKSVVKLLTKTLQYPDGTPVACVIADSTIGRVAESAACTEKFRRENVAVTITVTPCWCYGSETMDMDPHTVKAVWGFNGTERPGAVYLAAVLAAHAQKGLPAFGIYGHEVQDADAKDIPADVRDKLLRFARAAMAVASACVAKESMRSKSSVAWRTIFTIKKNIKKRWRGQRKIASKAKISLTAKTWQRRKPSTKKIGSLL